MRQYKSSLLRCERCKNRRIPPMILEIFQMWNQIIVEGCHRFPVNLWWFRVFVPRLAATNACHLTHGTRLDYRKNVFRNQFQRLKFLKLQGRRRPVARDEERIKCTIPMPTICKKAVDHEFIITDGHSAEFYVFGRQISELQFDKFSNSQTCLVWKFRFKTQVVMDHSSGSNVMDHSSGDGWFIGRNWNPRDQFVERIFQTSRCWTRRMPSALNKFILNSQTQEGQSRGTGSPEGGLFLCEEGQIAVMIHDYFRVTGAHDTVLDYAGLFSVTLHGGKTFRNSIQDGTKFCCPCQRYNPMISWKVCTKWAYVSPRNSKPYWNCMTWRLIRRS